MLGKRLYRKHLNNREMTFVPYQNSEQSEESLVGLVHVVALSRLVKSGK